MMEALLLSALGCLACQSSSSVTRNITKAPWATQRKFSWGCTFHQKQQQQQQQVIIIFPSPPHMSSFVLMMRGWCFLMVPFNYKQSILKQDWSSEHFLQKSIHFGLLNHNTCEFVIESFGLKSASVIFLTDQTSSSAFTVHKVHRMRQDIKGSNTLEEDKLKHSAHSRHILQLHLTNAVKR